MMERSSQRRYALQQLKEDDPLVQKLLKILQKVNRVSGALKENLKDKTTQWAQNLQETLVAVQASYDTDWTKYNEAVGNLLEISNNLQDLDEEAEHWVNFLEDQYAVAMELDMEATDRDYPDDHLVFQFVDKIEEVLNRQ